MYSTFVWCPQKARNVSQHVGVEARVPWRNCQLALTHVAISSVHPLLIVLRHPLYLNLELSRQPKSPSCPLHGTVVRCPELFLGFCTGNRNLNSGSWICTARTLTSRASSSEFHYCYFGLFERGSNSPGGPELCQQG